MNQSISRDSVGQSADLRTRIAAVQRAHRLVTRMVGRKAEKSCLCGWRSPERDCTFTDHPEHVADAVIAELGLDDTVRLLRASQVWIADAISEDPSGEPWLMSRTLLNQLISRVDSLGG